MVVAVVGVRRMQAAGDEEVPVVAVRHRVVPAARTVDVTAVVAARLPRVACRVAVVDRHPVLVDVIGVRMMQAAVVQVVDMTLVEHRDVPALGSVLVIVALVDLVSVAHASDARAGQALLSSTCG